MNSTFLEACRGKPVPYTPVWLMRQAGRYLPEYRRVRAKTDFLTLCKTPDLAAEVTLQPVDILKVDAAILFSDILVPLEPMGMSLNFSESMGPVLSDPVRSEADVSRLRVIDSEEDVPYVMEAVRILTRALKVPLIGFSGAPFTLATYMIEGGPSKTFLATKEMMYRSPLLFAALMEKITATVIDYLSAQAKAGVHAVQIFDTWAGALSPEDYARVALPYVKAIIAALRKREAAQNPPIIYFAFNAGGMLDLVFSSGADVFGIDWRIDIGRAIAGLGPSPVVQGNLDPCVLFGPPALIRERVASILASAGRAGGHIFNLGHGILPQTPPSHAVALVEAVHELSMRTGHSQ